MILVKGNIVRWTSQSAGITRTKQGVVVRVLDKHERPVEVGSSGMGREHESYLIRASVIDGSEQQRRRTRLYWPKVSKLEWVSAS
jgi:hypothetical protein